MNSIQERLSSVVSQINEINSSASYNKTYVIVDPNSLSGWFDPIVYKILERLDPLNLEANSRYHVALHHYYDRHKIWLDEYYITHPYLFQIVKTIGHWALINRIVELRVVTIPLCQEITGISNGQFQYSKLTDPEKILRAIKLREQEEKGLFSSEKVHEIIMEEINKECQKEHVQFNTLDHAKWAEERTTTIKIPSI